MEPDTERASLNNVTQSQKSSLERLQDVEAVADILRDVGRRVRAEAKRNGRKIPVWRNEQVVWVDPEEIDAEIERNRAK